jgi:hypothetical protein
VTGLVAVVILAWVMAGESACAAEAGSSKDEAIRLQVQEIERLERALQEAREKLRELTGDTGAARSADPKAGTAGLSASGPISTAERAALVALPPLEEGQVVSAAELLAHFRAAPEAAAHRYVDRVFRVQGEVHSFDLPLLTRNYAVKLAVPDRSVDLLFRFSYGDRYNAVFTKENGRVLVGRIDDRSARVLARVGDPVVIEGRCRGVKDGVLEFAACTRVK